MHKPKSHVRIEVAEREAPEGEADARQPRLEAPWKRRRRVVMRSTRHREASGRLA